MDELAGFSFALLVLIALSAFFSGSEAALFSLKPAQLKQFRSGARPAREIARLLDSPRRLLITILIGNLIVNVFSTSAATGIAVDVFGDSGVAVAFGFMSVLILILGEILPKVVAVQRPRRFSLMAIYPLRLFHFAFYPIQAPIALLTDNVIDFLKKSIGSARRHFSKEELLTAFDIAGDEGHVGEFEYELMRNIIEFRDTVVKEIMTPSIHVFSLSKSMNREEMEKLMVARGHSRVPVYGETADDVLGILHIKDIAVAPRESANFDVMSLLREPYYVPESMRISSLFTELARQRSHLALVIDEHGSYAGIVTMEDVLEELVGEIRDAREPQRSSHTLLDERRIVVLGSMEIDEFNDVFGTAITDEENETVAGYVLAATGTIPREGQTIRVGDLRFHIISAQPHRIRKMRVEKV